MKGMKWVHMTAALMVFTLAGCDYWATRLVTPKPTAESNLDFATDKALRLQTVAVGQTRDEVMKRMGTDQVQGCVEWSWKDSEYYLRTVGSYLRCTKQVTIKSPHRTVSFDGGGVPYEVLLYYTGGVGPDGDITDAQMTPVVIGNGRVVGWGWQNPAVQRLGLAPSIR